MCTCAVCNVHTITQRYLRYVCLCGPTLGHFGEVLLIDSCLCVAQNIPWLFGKCFVNNYSHDDDFSDGDDDVDDNCPNIKMSK